jgi:NAD(P) transhydrogenase subunit alpha
MTARTLAGCAAAVWLAAAVTVPGPLLAAEPAGHAASAQTSSAAETHAAATPDYWSMLSVLALATFIGLGVISRVSRLLHTPLMSLTNAISAIAVVGSIIVTGSDYPREIRFLGAVALFASMTNIVSGFLITDRMLKMFKQSRGQGGAR